MQLPSAPGVYRIRNTTNNKFYIGSAVNMARREYLHLHQLRRGEHHSIALQRAWKKYGATRFVFEVVELCYGANLLAREQWWLDNSAFSYNCSPTAGSTLGLKHTEEQKAANSARRKVACADPEYRKRQSEDGKRRMADPVFKAHCTRGLLALTTEQRKAVYTAEVRQKLAASAKRRGEVFEVGGRKLSVGDIEREFGVPSHTLYARVKRGWAVEKAATTPASKKHTPEAEKYEYKGQSRSLQQLSDLAGVTKVSIWRRLKAGLSAAQAVEMTKEQAKQWRLERSREARRSKRE